MSDFSPRVIETRNHLVAVARECLVVGKGDFEVTEFARTANVSVGLAYHHFGSKSGLIAAALETYFSQVEIALAHPNDPACSWVDDLRLRVRLAVETLLADPLTPVVFGAMGATTEVASAERCWRGRMNQAVAERLAVGQAEGYVSPKIDVEVAAAVMNAGLFEAAVAAGALGSAERSGALADDFWTLMVRALGIQSEPRPVEGSDRCGLVAASPAG